MAYKTPNFEPTGKWHPREHRGNVQQKEFDMDRYVVISPNGQVMGTFPDTPNGRAEAKEYAKKLSENSNP